MKRGWRVRFLANSIEDADDIKHLSFRLYDDLVSRNFEYPQNTSTFNLSSDDLQEMQREFKSAQDIVFTTKSAPFYFGSKLSSEKCFELNKNNQYKEGKDFEPCVRKFVLKNSKFLRAAIGPPFAVVNIRAWEMRANSSSFGPAAWHKDGFAEGHLKIMIYLSELSEEGGGIQFEHCAPVHSPPGYVLVFRNSDLSHRAIPGKNFSRQLVEITVQRSLIELDNKVLVGMANDRHLVAPWVIHQL